MMLILHSRRSHSVVSTRHSSRPNRHRNPLHNPPMIMPLRIHAIIDAEVAADQVRAHGGAFARERLRGMDSVGLVFAVVDADDAGVAGVRARGGWGGCV